MIEINWKIFEAKFNGKEQTSFEWLCYLLFCKEFDQPKGILRYKNQAGIETNPIDVNSEKVGWQAKFFKTRLSEHKQDFINSIDKAKKTHPEINKIIFYINKDFGPNPKKQTDPQYKKEIESHAQDKNIKIEWKPENFFKSPFVCEENKKIVQYFFSFEKSIFNFIVELYSHTISLLHPIQSEITYKTNKIKINRTQILKKLKSFLINSPAVILTGEAGSGKTAIIKDWYDELKEDNAIAFFIFKATEFNISHINDLFKNYGNFTLLDFIEEHRNSGKKYIIIDSAEKLSDLENHESFKEFLSTVIQNKWKIIFTTRYNYLRELKDHLAICSIIPDSLIVPKLTLENLTELSKKYDFALPRNQKLLELLQTPFYLNEYLKNYVNINKRLSYLDFRELIWKQKILNSSYQKNNIHRKREEYFLKLVKKRASENLFFVNIDGFNNEVPQALEADEIIKYDLRGYSINHDIYEEWALDKIIERDFYNSVDYKNFFKNIGCSLSIRIAFRNWLSEKLYIKDQEVKDLIEESIQNNDIEKHWKDEILVSVLLSNYCSHFFEIFKLELLKKSQPKSINNEFQNNIQSHYDQGLLYKLLFLLRIACKEADESIFDTYKLPKTNKNKKAFKTILMQPKGKGWDCMIAFLNKYKKQIGLDYITLALPVISDWNTKNKKGETTKNASQLALFYYDEITKENSPLRYSFRNEAKKQITKIILNGSFEIKNELTKIFQDVISKKETNRNDKYYFLIHTILSSSLESIELIKHCPKQVIQLAKLFWFRIPNKKELRFGRFPIPIDHNPKIEECFSITNKYEFNYFPPSALKTPILSLLIFSYKQTVNFILSFTNKSVESFARSRLTNRLEEVKVHIDKKTSVKQYISPILWNMYRGGSQVPDLLESIHMALERYFLYNCKDTPSDILEERLLYLLRNSKSSSISAVVASIVLAYPEKTFNVAKILLQTKKFILYDNTRCNILDQRPINNFLNLANEDLLFKNERIESNKLEHRKKSLKFLAFEYQFPSKDTTEKKTKNRQQVLWKIFDNYRQQLFNQNSEVKDDVNWKFCLAHMDARKVKQKIKKINGKSLIAFQPDISPELERHRKDSLKIFNEANKYTSLRLWAEYKFEKNENKYKQYTQYENNLKLVVQETKDIVQKLENIPGDFNFPFFSKKFPSFEEYQRITFEKDQDDKNSFRITNHSIPLYTCAVLMRDYFDQLNQEDKIFCQEAIMKCVSYLIQNDNQHQSIEGRDVAVKAFSFLFNLFPEKKAEIKSMLFALLIKGGDLNKHIVRLIVDMWEDNFEDAHSIFLGYLLLKQDFDNLSMKEYQLANRNLNYDYSENKVLDSFLKTQKKELEHVIKNRLTYRTVSKVCNFKEFHLDILITAFEMLPAKTEDKDHKEFIKTATKIFLEKLFISNNATNSYELKVNFLKNFSCFILNLKIEEVETYLKPFLNHFEMIRIREYQEYFFDSFISTEDKLNQYENFWIVWNLFYLKIVEMCKKNVSDFDKTIIYNYLLAGPSWKKDARDWHTLKDREKLFFKKASKDMGHHPTVLYSISKLLNNVGSNFIDDGILWISDIIQDNQDLLNKELDTNTILYMENVLRRYVLNNRHKIKTKSQIKIKILSILNFLVGKGSATAYHLREDIL